MTTQQEQESGQASEGEETPKPPPRRRASKATGAAAAEAGTGKKPARGGGTRKKATAAGGERSKTKGQTSRTGTAKTAASAPKEEPQPVRVPRLLVRFREEISPALMKEFGYTSPMAVPALTKIVLNIGMGEALDNPRAMDNAARDLTAIAGQHPITNRARKSIAAFKVREGMPLGLSVTLRGKRMYEFFDRLVSSSLPRIRDFRGVSREAFDGRGNYALGIREQVMFPEIDYNSIDRIRGLQTVIVTTARTDHEGLRLLEMMGIPFVRVETGAAA